MTIYFWYALLIGVVCSILVVAGCFSGRRRWVIAGMVFSAIVASPITTFTYGTAGAIYASDMVGFCLLLCYFLAKDKVLTTVVPRWYKPFFWYMVLALISTIVIAPIVTSNLGEAGLTTKIISPVPGVPIWLLMAAFRVVRIILYLVFFSFACHMIIDDEHLSFAIRTVLISIVFLGICQIITFLKIKDLSLYLPWDVYQRLHIVGHSKAAAGRLYVMGIFLAMSVMYRSWKVLLYLGYFAIVTMALLFSGSRAALLAVIIGFMVFVWKGDAVWKMWALVFLALIPVGFIILEQINPERVRSFAEIIKDPSSSSRWQIWSWSIHNLFDNPQTLITGVGFANFRYALIAETEIYHAHNDFITCVTEIGVIGVLVFIWYLVRLLKDVGGRVKHSSGEYRWQAICMSSILAGFLVSSLFEFSLYYSSGSAPMQRTFAIMFGVFTAFWAQQDSLAEQEDSEYVEALEQFGSADDMN